MLPLNPPPRVIGRRCCLSASRPLALASRGGLSPFRSHARRTPWSVFQDGSNETVTPTSLTCLVPHLARGEMGTDRPRAHVGFLDPTHRSERARRWEKTHPPSLSLPTVNRADVGRSTGRAHPPRNSEPETGSFRPPTLGRRKRGEMISRRP